MVKLTHSANFIIIFRDINKEHSEILVCVGSLYFRRNIVNKMQRTLLSLQVLLSAVLSFRVVKQTQTAEVSKMQVDIKNIKEYFTVLFRKSRRMVQ